jgi:hypothetical protein
MLMSLGVKANLVIRPLVPSDLDQVVAIEADAFPCPWTAKEFRRTLRMRHVAATVAQIGDRVVGKLSGKGPRAIVALVREGNLDAQLFWSKVLKPDGFKAEAIIANPWDQGDEDAIRFAYRLSVPAAKEECCESSK